MLKKPRLSKELSMQLAGLSTPEKLSKLMEWKDKNFIDKKTYDYFVRAWQEKETKRETRRLYTRTIKKREGPSLAAEGELDVYIQHLRTLIQNYRISGAKWSISNGDLAKFKNYVEKYSISCRRKINEIIILGMRIPDESKELVSFCLDTISNPKGRYYEDDLFWKDLWQSKFVPRDAIDLMLTHSEYGYKMNSLFDSELIKEIIPLIEVQRGQELKRLEIADSDIEKSRRAKRLAAFDTLLKAANEYCK